MKTTKKQKPLSRYVKLANEFKEKCTSLTAKDRRHLRKLGVNLIPVKHHVTIPEHFEWWWKNVGYERLRAIKSNAIDRDTIQSVVQTAFIEGCDFFRQRQLKKEPK